MPTFVFTTPDGQHHERFYRSHKDRPDSIRVGGQRAAFDYLATIGSVKAVPTGAYPVYSRSMGVRKEDLAEARRRFPGHEFAPDGRRIIRSPGNLRRILNDLNRDARADCRIEDLR